MKVGIFGRGRRGTGRGRTWRRLAVTPAIAAAVAFAAVPLASAGGSVAGAATASSTTTADGVVIDAWGGLHPFGYGGGTSIHSFTRAPYWPGLNIVRGVALRATNNNTCAAFGGYTLDRFGGLHPFGINGSGQPARLTDGPYWKGWDVARDVALVPQDPRNPNSQPAGGFVLDAFGGLHWFTIKAGAQKPTITGGPYWRGRDLARGVIILTTSSGYEGGFVVDAFGGLHRFTIESATPPAVDQSTLAYWNGFPIVQGGSSVPGTTVNGGFTLDGWGGLHPFKVGTGPAPSSAQLHGVPYWKGFDIARGVAMRVRKAGC